MKHEWEVVDHVDWINGIPYTWDFKQKYYPHGNVQKLKYLFCTQFDHQIEGVNLFDKFALVIKRNNDMIMLKLPTTLRL